MLQKWRLLRHFISRKKVTSDLRPIDRKSNHVRRFLPQRQHLRRSTPSATPEQSGRPAASASSRFGQSAAAADRERRAYDCPVQSAVAAHVRPSSVETIRQLNTFVVHLKALGDMILGTDLCSDA